MVLDLRSKREVEMNPDPKIEGIESVWMDWDEGKMPKAVEMERFTENGGMDGYRDMYLDVLGVYTESFKAGFNWILRRERGEIEGGMLFHCTGKSHLSKPCVLGNCC
jgi:hypothetical protein